MSALKRPMRPPVAGSFIILAFSLLLIRIPLLNYLGYEFSFAVSLAIPLLAGLPAIRLFRARFPDRRAITLRDFHQTNRRALARGWAILLVPLAVATVNLFFVRNCSYGEGLLFFVLIPGITVFWSVGLALLCATLFRRAYLFYTIALAACFLYPIYIGYTSPQIYSYNFVYGFFPGFSYDEVLTITPGLLLFRLVTVLSALLFFSASEFAVEKGAAAGKQADQPRGFSRWKWKHIRTVLSVVLVALAWFLRVPLGFETSTEFLERTLGSSYSTEHFRIVYSRESISQSEIGRIAALHEYRYAQVEAALQIRYRGRVVSYVYPDGETKLRLIGTKTTNIAKPWRHEIHLDKDALEGTLKHEMVHVLAGEFGMPVIKAHYHIGLVEGLAMAVDADFGNRTLDEYAAAIKRFKLVTDPTRLINPIGFAMRGSTISYVLMGSFCRYLIDRYGIVLFRGLYGGKSPAVVYGKSYDDLIDEWQGYLERFDVPESWRKHVEYYFNRPSIFAKECAREVAKRNEEGYRNLVSNNPAAAMEKFSAALNTSWNTESYSGLVRSAFGAARFDTVVRLIDARAGDSVHSSGLINLNLLYGDALWHRGDIGPARKAYGDILAFDLSENQDESAAIRLAALEDKILRTALPEYVVGALSDSAALRLLRDLRHRSTDPIVPYLEGRFFLRQKQYEQAFDILRTTAGRLGAPILNARAEQMIGEACFRLGKFQDARVHFWQSLNFVTNTASIRRVDDWLDRCEWFAANGGRYVASRR